MNGIVLSKDHGAEFSRVVRLGSVADDWRKWNRRLDIFCQVAFKDGRLSISGVVGPTPSGNALGSCGQIDMTLRDQQDKIRLAPGWTRDALARFFQVWKDWHLNDMSPACEHQIADGWLDRGGQEVTLYHWEMRLDACKRQNTIKAEVLQAAQIGAPRMLEPAEQRLLALPYEVTTHTPDAPGDEYGPRRALSTGARGPTETKQIRWLRPADHPEGMLTRPCPACGYRYGSAWLKREVPADVLEFLRGLPLSDKSPAWV